ncbi:hypothetical protein CEXT_286671 [Caerostris extrusa]|uniref:Uncharacterized protein n=1 Tax=Caerostris extrusa TaxID=172846 RepID=A0AAV4U971_CAEEX|nr:hypothetical protein CEXT_286671 [Caerostris extrusa]
MRANATDCENTKSMLEKEYEDIHQMRKEKQRMLNEYLVIQKKLFSQRANKLENMRKEMEKSGEEIYLALSEKLRKM